MSSSSMIVATQTATSVHHRRGSGASWGGVIGRVNYPDRTPATARRARFLVHGPAVGRHQAVDDRGRRGAQVVAQRGGAVALDRVDELEVLVGEPAHRVVR